MSLCFRVLPGRLSSLVGGRKPLSKLDRHQLRKHIESSAFLEQFLSTQRALSIRTNVTGKATVPSLVHALHQNLSLASLDACGQWSEKPINRYDEESRCASQIRRSHRSQKSNVVVIGKSRKHVAAIGITDSDEVTVFQARNVVENDKTNSSFLDNRIVVLASESSHGSVVGSRESSIERSLLLTDDGATLKTSQRQSPPQNEDGKPSQEQLQYVLDYLSQDLPKLFVKPLNYSMYTNDIIFINNIRGVTTQGLGSYMKQLAFLKVIGHLKYAYVKLDIIKITMHTEDATVKVRWRIRGVTSLKMIRIFWKYKIWKIQEAIDRDHELWYDGFSTFYVNGEGKIYKHVADKVMPDQDMAEKKENLRIAPKLALFIGLAGLLDSDNQDFFELNSALKLYRSK